jgi:hypothetical protein
MASGSGKNQDGNQAKEPVEREESNTAAAAEPPPPAPPSDGLQERAHGSPEAGGQNPSVATAAEAAAAAQPKGSEIVAAPSWRHDAGDKSPLLPRAASVSRASEPKSAAGNPLLPPRASGSKGKKPMADAEVVNSGRDVRNKWRDMREGRMHMNEVFEELLEESKANAEMDQEDDTEGTAMQPEQVRFLGSLAAFLSDSCLLVIWGNRILPFLRTSGKISWLEPRNCVASEIGDSVFLFFLH